ncbi:MAG TPA: prolipoprotein diacylglyceryl transferase [Coriobacteriia bacterium]
MAAFAFPNIDPVAFHVGPLAVRWYGLAYMTAFLAAWWILKRLDERWDLGLGPDGRAATVLAAVIGVIVGGRLGYVLFYGAGVYWREPVRILQLWDGGMSFHGGLVGLLLAGAWVARRYHVPFLRLTDAGAIAAPIGLFLGRIANFINDELWGRVTNVPWGVVFPNAPDPTTGLAVARHPSQLYEAGLEGLVLFGVMLWLARRDRTAGEITGWLLTLYAVFRIFVEFFREPDVQIKFLPAWITMGQILSIPVLLAGVWLLWWVRRTGVADSEGPETAPRT